MLYADVCGLRFKKGCHLLPSRHGAKRSAVNGSPLPASPRGCEVGAKQDQQERLMAVPERLPAGLAIAPGNMIISVPQGGDRAGAPEVAPSGHGPTVSTRSAQASASVRRFMRAARVSRPVRGGWIRTRVRRSAKPSARPSPAVPAGQCGRVLPFGLAWPNLTIAPGSGRTLASALRDCRRHPQLLPLGLSDWAPSLDGAVRLATGGDP
jgi:hypothetical protein